MIEFSRGAYTDMIRHATAGGLEEVCGVLGGRYGPERSVIEITRPVENIADRPRIRYEMDPERLLAVIERIEEMGLDVAGFYHSHPAGDSTPSQTDVERATWDGYSYVICTADGSVSVDSWRWDGSGGAFDRESITIT